MFIVKVKPLTLSTGKMLHVHLTCSKGCQCRKRDLDLEKQLCLISRYGVPYEESLILHRASNTSQVSMWLSTDLPVQYLPTFQPLSFFPGWCFCLDGSILVPTCTWIPLQAPRLSSRMAPPTKPVSASPAELTPPPLCSLGQCTALVHRCHWGTLELD